MSMQKLEELPRKLWHPLLCLFSLFALAASCRLSAGAEVDGEVSDTSFCKHHLSEACPADSNNKPRSLDCSFSKGRPSGFHNSDADDGQADGLHPAHDRPIAHPVEKNSTILARSSPQLPNPDAAIQDPHRAKVAVGAQGEWVSGKEEEQALQEFLLWLKEKGAIGAGDASSPLQVSFIPLAVDHAAKQCVSQRIYPKGKPWTRGNIGIIARTDIESGEALVSIPKSLWMWSRMFGEEMKPYEGSSSPWTPLTTLAAGLLRERAKGNDSHWAPYIRLLPTYIPLPMFFPSQVLQEFDYQPFFTEVLQNLKGMEEEFKRCRPEALGGASMADFFWAASVVRSRAFPVLSEGSGDSHGGAALVPFVDFWDHSFENQFEWKPVRAEKSSWQVQAATPVGAGSPTYISYGEKGNERFVIAYGFLPPDNPHDSLRLFEYLHDVVQAFSDLRLPLWGVESETSQREASRKSLNKVEALRVAGKAVAAVNSNPLQAGGKDFGLPLQGPEMTYVEQISGYSVWPGARVEPRLLASLAAMWHLFHFGEEPNFRTIASASIRYGRNIGQLVCNDSAFGDRVRVALHFAVRFLDLKLRVMVKAFSTTLEEDLQILTNITICIQRSDMYTKSSCLFNTRQKNEQYRIAVLFRSNKKSLLANILRRFEQTCT